MNDAASTTGDAVTIVIPTYGQSDVLAEAISSALQQTHPRLEVLVMDDASPDRTPEVVERFSHDPRVRALRNPHNVGRVANYRRGLENARGDWVLVLDGDDVLVDSGFVASALSVVAADAGIVLAIGGQRLREVEGGRYRELYPTTRARERVDGWTFFRRWISPVQSVPHFGSLYRAEAARATGFYTHDIISADWESLRRLCLRGDVILLRRLAGEWRGHGDNFTKQIDPRLHLENMTAILGPWAAALRQGRGGPRLTWWKWRALQSHVAVYLEAALTQGDVAAAREFDRGLAERLGGLPAMALVWSSALTRPSLWAKSALRVIGGRSLLARAQRVWHRLTWSRE